MISGKIVDQKSGEAIPFASIRDAANPTSGTSADFDGLFQWTFAARPDSIICAAIGYSDLTIVYNGESVLNIKMTASSLALNEVVVKGKKRGEDPAYLILKKIIQQKPINDIHSYETYACDIYSKAELDFINITEEFKSLRVNRPFSFVYEQIDSTSEDEPFLPLFLSETFSKLYVKNEPHRQHEILQAAKIVGDYRNETLAGLLSVARQTINVYKNWIEITGKQFSSPIANNGPSLYRYYLEDTLKIDNHECFQVQFFPRHKGVNGFYGYFYVDTMTYAIKQIRLEIAEEGHINLIDKLLITQNYNQDPVTHKWGIEREKIYLVSSNITEIVAPGNFKKLHNKAPAIQLKRNAYYSDYIFNKEVVENHINAKINVEPDAFNYSDEYWEENRPESLTSSEHIAYHLIDTLIQLPAVKSYRRFMSGLTGGYVWGPYWETGNIYDIYSRNDIEGHRFKLGGRTNQHINKNLRVGLFGAYGTKDKRFKWGSDFTYILNHRPRKTISASYMNDYFPNPNFDRTISITSDDNQGSSTFLRRRNIPYKLLDVEQVYVQFYQDISNRGLSFMGEFIHQYNKPFFNFNYRLSPTNEIHSYRKSELAVTFRYAPDETFVDGTYNRQYIGSSKPILTLRVAQALKGAFNSDIGYSKIQLTLQDKVEWGRIGFTLARFRAGYLLGNVPYLDMFLPAGNEALFFNLDGVNMLPEYAFAADQYAVFDIDHHFDGFILQGLKIFRVLKMRSVANFRMFWGDINDDNLASNKDNLYENTTPEDAVRIRRANKAPYMEASLGIENIFRLLRVDAIWRLNYDGSFDANKFGVRMGVEFRL